VCDRDTLAILAVNEATVQLYGWTRAELLAMNLADVRPPEDRASFFATLSALPPDAAPFPRRARHWKKTGERIDVDLEVALTTLGGQRVAIAVVTDLTGLEHAERRFRLLVEHSTDGVAMSREDGTVEYISAGGARVLGTPGDAIVGTHLIARVHPEDALTWCCPDPGDSTTRTMRVLHADGEWRWLETTTTNLLHDPAVSAFVSNFRDITSRKLAEDASRRAQHRLEYLISSTAAVTYSARIGDGRGTAFISPNVQQIVGYTPDDFYADPEFWWKHVHPEDVVPIEGGLPRMAHGEEITFEYRFLHRDGTYRHVRDTCRLSRDEHGKPLEVVGYWADVTEQHRAAASLRRSEANFRALIERSPAATVVHRGGQTIYVNPAVVALLGYDRAEDLVGRPMLDLVHPDDRDDVCRQMQAPSGADARSIGEARLLRRDGGIVIVEAEAIRLDFDGEPAHVVISRNVGEQRELLARMAMADRMVTVGTLAAGVAHEINNPLAYVTTNLELLARKLARPDLQGLVADAQDGVGRMRSIVRGLRELSRPDDDAHVPIEVTAVLASSIKMALNEIRHRARVVETYATGLPRVQANASRLGQVFLNLLLNAAHAIPAGRAERNEIQVRAHPCVSPAGVCVEIQDTGVGIAPAHLRRIFDPFFTTKGPGDGIGLGLSISHGIVRAMGGEITVESSPGVGSTFRVVLPCSSGAEEVNALAVPVSNAAGARVLLIDDEAAVGRSLIELLAPENTVVAVTRAHDAIQLLARGEHFDVIVCDLMMPEITGIELYEQLDDKHRARVIFMTGGAFTPQARQFLSRVERPHVDKPFSEAELRDAIDRVVHANL
jgi:PAS domain S-box-containing protein